MSKFGTAVQSDSVAAAALSSSSVLLHLTITLYDRETRQEGKQQPYYGHSPYTTFHFLNGKSTWATASFETDAAAAAAAMSGIFLFFYFFDWSTSSPSAAAAAHSATLRRQSIIIDSMTPIRVDAPLEKEEEEMPDRQGPSFHNSDKVCVLLERADCLY